jgi:benzoyl-CoA 2,3-dioxygenase component A
MDTAPSAALVKQHLIDPEVCIRCNTCEATCPTRAISHDDRNYVVDPKICNGCMACIAPCPTGAIDRWRMLPMARAYSIAEQLGWDTLPRPEPANGEHESARGAPESGGRVSGEADGADSPASGVSTPAAALGAAVPPWSAERASVHLYAPRSAAKATVILNANCTEAGYASETHHIVLDLGKQPFPVLEGQSIGILPPGVDAAGRPHRPRLYSVASPRDGERSKPGHVALTVKRLTEDFQGRMVRGVASHYLCDLEVGDTVFVIGPFGTSFLMPNHARSNLIMICTGTGSAPMRAMTERRRKLRRNGNAPEGKLMLFFGARTPSELPYYGPLQSLPKDFIDLNLAYSRLAGTPKRYVQDLVRERADDVGALLEDPDTYVYVCGITRMETGVLDALGDVAREAGLDWEALNGAMRREGRLHLETY